MIHDIPAIDFPVWTTIKLGIPYKLNCGFSGVAWHFCESKEFLDSIAVNEIELDLVLVKPSQLGLSYFNSYDTLCTLMCFMGYQMCPYEVAVQIPSQTDEFSAKSVVIASSLMEEQALTYYLLGVEEKGGKIITSYVPMLKHPLWCGDKVYVFVKPKD